MYKYDFFLISWRGKRFPPHDNMRKVLLHISRLLSTKFWGNGAIFFIVKWNLREADVIISWSTALKNNNLWCSTKMFNCEKAVCLHRMLKLVRKQKHFYFFLSYRKIVIYKVWVFSVFHIAKKPKKQK